MGKADRAEEARRIKAARISKARINLVKTSSLRPRRFPKGRT